MALVVLDRDGELATNQCWRLGTACVLGEHWLLRVVSFGRPFWWLSVEVIVCRAGYNKAVWRGNASFFAGSSWAVW